MRWRMSTLRAPGCWQRFKGADMVDFKKQIKKKASDASEVTLSQLTDGKATSTDALLGKKPKAGELIVRPVDQFLPDERQPRKTFRDEELEQLRQSIEERGQLQPILVRPEGDKFRIVAGERRWRAIQRSGLVTTVRAVVADSFEGELDVLMVQLDENNKREDVPLVETVDAYALVVELCGKVGKTKADAAKMLNISPPQLSKFLGLADRPPELTALCLEGVVNDFNTLYEINKKFKELPDETREFIARVRSGEIKSVRAAVSKIRPAAEAKAPTNSSRAGSGAKPAAQRVSGIELKDKSLVLQLEDGEPIEMSLTEEMLAKLKTLFGSDASKH